MKTPLCVIFCIAIAVTATIAGDRHHRGPETVPSARHNSPDTRRRRIDAAHRRHIVVKYEVSYFILVYNDATLEFTDPVTREAGEGILPGGDRDAGGTPPEFPGQCAAIATSTEKRCRNRALQGQRTCQFHSPD